MAIMIVSFILGPAAPAFDVVYVCGVRICGVWDPACYVVYAVVSGTPAFDIVYVVSGAARLLTLCTLCFRMCPGL